MSKEEWSEIVARIRRGIKDGQFVDGLVEAIGMCGSLLKSRGLEVSADDADELRNRLRVRE